MIRFDIVVATHGRSELFWQGFDNIKNFDKSKDRIIIFDCSEDYDAEAKKSLPYLAELGGDVNFLFFTRENTGRNPGCILDYARCLAYGKIETPRYSFFVQDHYLNREKFVADDTIPDGFVWDLDDAEKKMGNDKKVVFGAKNGILIISSVSEKYCGADYVPTQLDDDLLYMEVKLDDGRYFEIVNSCCHGQVELEGGVDLGLAVDGINLCADPAALVEFYKNNENMCLNTIGDYGDAYIWEGRIGKIFSDAGYEFHDLLRDVVYKTPADVRARGQFGKDWFYFYPTPLFAVFHGKDLWKHEFKLSAPYFRYATYLAEYRKKRRDHVIQQVVFITP